MDQNGVPCDLGPAFWDAIRENIRHLDEIAEWWSLLSEGAEPRIEPGNEGFVAEALQLLPPPPFDQTSWTRWTREVAEQTGRRGKKLYLPLRQALTGRDSGPEMQVLMPLMRRIPRSGV